MAKVDSTRIAAIKAKFEHLDVVTEPNMITLINAIAEAAQEHAHLPTGGAGSGTGDAARVKSTAINSEGSAAGLPLIADGAGGALFQDPVCAAIYTTAAGQSIPNNTTTIVNFGTKVKDTHNAVTTGAAWKFTAPTAGFYQVSVQVWFQGSSGWEDTEYAHLALWVNADLAARLDYKDSYGSASSVCMQLNGSTLVFLNAGDYLDIRVIQTSDAALPLSANSKYNRISIAKV